MIGHSRALITKVAAGVCICAAVMCIYMGHYIPSAGYVNSVIQPSWPPYLGAIPDSAGTSLTLYAAGLGVDNAQLEALVEGPTSHMESHTLTYDPARSMYLASFDGIFDPNIEWAEGTIAVTLSVGTSERFGSSTTFLRALVPYDASSDIAYNHVWLHLEENTLPASGYVLLMPTVATPGRLPANHRLMAPSYLLEASGAITQMERPALLAYRFDPGDLAGTDPNDLAIYMWLPESQSWQNLGGTYISRDSSISTVVQRLTAYVLLAPVPIRLHLPVIMVQ